MRTPRRTNLKIQISRSSLRCTKSALVGARPHSLFKSSDSNVVYVLVTNGNAFTWCCTCVCSRFSRVWLFMTLSTGARQDPLSTGFPRQEYWSGLPFPSPGHLPYIGIECMSLVSVSRIGRQIPYHWCQLGSQSNFLSSYKIVLSFQTNISVLLGVYMRSKVV